MNGESEIIGFIEKADWLITMQKSHLKIIFVV